MESGPVLKSDGECRAGRVRHRWVEWGDQTPAGQPLFMDQKRVEKGSVRASLLAVQDSLFPRLPDWTWPCLDSQSFLVPLNISPLP